LLLHLFWFFSLAGCGDKEESKKFSANLNGTEIAITYVYKR